MRPRRQLRKDRVKAAAEAAVAEAVGAGATTHAAAASGNTPALLRIDLDKGSGGSCRTCALARIMEVDGEASGRAVNFISAYRAGLDFLLDVIAVQMHRVNGWSVPQRSLTTSRSLTRIRRMFRHLPVLDLEVERQLRGLHAQA